MMRLSTLLLTLTASLTLCSCVKGPNPVDPYESYNRKIHRFNMAFDATVLKPPAKLYKAVVPGPVRAGVHNALVNFNTLPIIANDLLQLDWRYAVKDSWRFFINTTVGIAGVFDAAEKCGLPYHGNDFGLTLAKWGDKTSPYLVLPFIGPSTIRDGMGMLYDAALFSPYFYIDDEKLVYALLGVQYLDIRTQLLDTERLLDQALDKYSFIRDAYLQHRNYAISGVQQNVEPEEIGSLYVDEDELGDYIDDDQESQGELKDKANLNDKKLESIIPPKPKTSEQVKHVAPRPISA